MNTTVTSAEQILTAALELARKSGLEALSMRSVAAHANIAVGSLYNYFPSKGALMTAVAAEMWRSIFPPLVGEPKGDFMGALTRLYESLLEGTRTYPSLFTTHAQLFDREMRGNARQAMQDMLDNLRSALMRELTADPRVRPDAFGDEFTRGEFIDYVLDSLIALLRCNCASCPTLLKSARRLIY